MGFTEKQELAHLRNERKARDLCESLEFNPTLIQVKAIAGLRDEKDRKALAKSFKDAKARATHRANTPRTATGRTLLESNRAKSIAAKQAFAESILG